MNAATAIVEKARELGAAAAGIASVELLGRSPSYQLLARFGTKIDGEYAFDADKDLRQVAWPAAARSAVVLGVSHPRDAPELDWSYTSGNTPGNKLLMTLADDLSAWAGGRSGLRVHRMPYWVEEGGVYLKDAAVLAGLGCIGRNNLLVTPELGPRIRWRAILLEEHVAPTGPIEFDPCRACDEPCRAACPQRAFEKTVLSPAQAGTDALPARDGTFSRSRCFVQLGQDVDESGVQPDDEFMMDRHVSGPQAEAESRHEGRIKWCRRCELACPVGAQDRRRTPPLA